MKDIELIQGEQTEQIQITQLGYNSSNQALGAEWE